MTEERMRLDVFLWRARFFKARTSATEAIEANGARPVTIGADPQGLSLILGRCRISSIASATISSCGNAVYHARLASRSVLAGRSSMAREPGGPRCLESWWWYWPRRPIIDRWESLRWLWVALIAAGAVVGAPATLLASP